ncbi:MAG TPA: pantoate--beta-alanine ligase [Candidatus Limnocylindria bacterium]|nr:pantoate--beta-alanine ligase [Candidatus Limnocylindria bacterium]
MKVLRTVSDVRAWRAGVRRVGLVPTMGALHAGHLSLVERAVRETDAAIASIFVNPTQFGPSEDFAAYPRREAEDIALLEQHACAAAFVPPVAEIYPPGDATRVTPGPIAAPLEGAARPGHFVGVATVVAKLLAIVRPDIAFFGQKDFQQLRVLQTIARDLRLGADIVGCPIVREPDGLAMSSRNAYLTPEQRRDAVALSRGLFRARDLWEQGMRHPVRLSNAVRRYTDVPSVSLEYVSVADPLTLAELDALDAPADTAVISLAARVGRARLIDNVLLGMDVADLR